MDLALNSMSDPKVTAACAESTELCIMQPAKVNCHGNGLPFERCFSSAAHAFDLVLGHVAEQQGQGRQLAAAGELHRDPLAGQVQLPHAGQPGQGRQVVRAVVLDLDRGQLREGGDGGGQPGQDGAAAQVQGPQVGQRADLLGQVPQEACTSYSVP